MAVFNGAFPILPGKEAAAHSFADDINGARRNDFTAMQMREGITRETWSF